MTKEQEDKIKEHYNNPKNNKALENYNARGKGKNPDNWGEVDMYLLIEDDIVKNLGYEFKGCPTIAFSASVFTEELKNVPLKDAIYTTEQELIEMESDKNSDDCIKMILVAFLAAVDNYNDRKNNIVKEDYNTKMIKLTGEIK